jgi:hypothetical protein
LCDVVGVTFDGHNIPPSVTPVNSFFQFFQKNFFEELKRPVITDSFEEKIFSIGRGSAHNIFVDRQRPEDVPMRSGRLGQLRQRQIIILKYPAVDRRQHPEEIPPASLPAAVVISCYQLICSC